MTHCKEGLNNAPWYIPYNTLLLAKTLKALHVCMYVCMYIYIYIIQRSRLRRPISKIRMILLMDAKTWMTSLIIMFAVRPICVQDSIFKMSSESSVIYIYIYILQSLKYKTPKRFNSSFPNDLNKRKTTLSSLVAQQLLWCQSPQSIKLAWWQFLVFKSPYNWSGAKI